MRNKNKKKLGEIIHKKKYYQNNNIKYYEVNKCLQTFLKIIVHKVVRPMINKHLNKTYF